MNQEAIPQEEEKFIEIRASGLPNHSDCARAWAYKQAQDHRTNLKPIFEGWGFEVKTRRTGLVGAVVGDSCHHGFGQMFINIMNSEDADPAVIALEKFHKSVRTSEITYDTGRTKITPDQDVAESQIERMVRAYEPFARSLDVVRTEIRLFSRPDPLKNYLLTGTPDIHERNGNIRDMKFGKKEEPYETQLGAYRLMARSKGIDVNGLYIDLVKRATIKKEQPPHQILPIDPKMAENAAWYELDFALKELEKFKETGNPNAFPARPKSLLCSKKWCPAWGTPFCDRGRPDKESEDAE